MDSKRRDTDVYLEHAANAEGFSVYFSVTIIAMALDTYTGHFAGANLYMIILIITLLMVVSYFQAKNTFNINQHKSVVISSFHLVWLLAVVFVIPPGSLYLALGAQLAYQTYFSYGRQGSILSIEFQILSLALAYYFMHEVYTLQNFADLVRTAALIIMLTVGYVALLDVARKEIARVNSVSDKLFTTSHRMELMVNSMNEAMIATDVFGKIIEYNTSTLSLLDTTNDLHGKFLNEVLNIHNENDETVDLLAQARSDNKVLYRTDLYHRYGKGDSARLSITVNPIIMSVGDDQVNGFTFIIADITKKMSLEEQRDEFISVVSHELRTPVAVAEGNLDIAKSSYEENPNDISVAEKLKAAQDQIHYLSDLVNDLVVLSMSEGDKAQVKIEKFSPGKLGHELQEQFLERANAKSLQLSLNAQDEMKVVETSRVFVIEILKNFLTNAIKYTDEGEVSIKISQDELRTTFEVTDTGRGISKSDQKHIFEKFFRAEEFHTRETGGTGLGLHVVLQLASRIGGEVTFESELGKGSTFKLKISNKHPSIH